MTDLTPVPAPTATEKIVPYDFQLEGIDFLKTGKALALCDPQGMGKTITTLFRARELDGPILVICRPLAKPYWKAMIKAIDPKAPISSYLKGDVYNEDRIAEWFGKGTGKRKRGYFLIHHEALSTPFDRKTKETSRSLAPKLRSHGIWELIIADEAHRFKNRDAQSTQSLKYIPTWNKYALTGTPMEKSPADFWSVLNWLDKAKFDNYNDFFEQFVSWKPAGYGQKKILGPKNVERLAELVAPYYLRREKTTVSLPPKTVTRVPITMTPAQRALYDRLEEETLIDIDNDEDNALFIPNALARMYKLKLAALHPSLINSNADSAKMLWLQDWVEDNADEPFVVFTQSRVFADALPISLDGGGVISGSVSQDKRDQTLLDWQEGRLQYIVGTIDTMAESVNLDRASIAIFMDMHMSSIAMNQAEERVHRLTSLKPVQIIYLTAEESIDDTFWDRLHKKWSDIDMIEGFFAQASARRHFNRKIS